MKYTETVEDLRHINIARICIQKTSTILKPKEFEAVIFDIPHLRYVFPYIKLDARGFDYFQKKYFFSLKMSILT